MNEEVKRILNNEVPRTSTRTYAEQKCSAFRAIARLLYDISIAWAILNDPKVASNTVARLVHRFHFPSLAR